MDSITVNTHHNVLANYTKAGVMDRVWATLLDFLILGSVSIIIGATVGYSIDGNVAFMLFVIIGLLNWLYWLLCEWRMNGQTLGKRALNIRVVKVDGSAPTFIDYFLRWLLIIFDYYLSSGAIALLSIVSTKNNQRLGDLLAATTVIKTKASTSKSIRESMMIQKLEEGYEPTYVQAKSLDSEDLALIKRALEAFEISYHIKPLDKLKRKMCEKLQIESKLPPKKFLTTMVKDHTYFQSAKKL